MENRNVVFITGATSGFGEAAALMFTAGMSTDIDWSDWNVLSPACALTMTSRCGRRPTTGPHRWSR